MLHVGSLPWPARRPIYEPRLQRSSLGSAQTPPKQRLPWPGPAAMTPTRFENRLSAGLRGLARLGRLRDVAAVKLAAGDIVRHPLVQKIVAAYDQDSRKRR